MKAETERNLIFKVIEYAMDRDTFTLAEMEEHFKEQADSWSYIRNTLVADNAGQTNPNHIIVVSNPKFIGMTLDDYSSRYKLLPSALFCYVDHLEIVEARKAALDARKLSWIAIGISIGIGVIQIVLEVIDKIV